MCCIVLKFYYFCDVIRDKPVKSYHEFLKYSTITIWFTLNPIFSFSHDDGIKEAGARSKSIAMKNYFS